MSSKKSKIERPSREPDHYSDRDVPYWWAPEWVRGSSADNFYDKPQPGQLVLSDGRGVSPCPSYGRIVAVKENGDVNLYMANAKDDKLTFIQGRIQKQFKKWHEDRSIDYMLLGMDPDDIINERQ